MDLRDNEIQVELPPRFRMYKSGRVERFVCTDVVPAASDPATGVSSKDVEIQPDTGVSARLYLPTLVTSRSSPRPKLPVLVYYHGGGFCIESASSPTYHNYLNSLVSQAEIIAVSVEYRRVPEHLLPAAYDDCWTALRWVASHAGGGPEEWLVQHADVSRVFIAGDSAGANIAHHVALRVGGGLEHGMAVQGLALVHPYFWGTEPLAGEPRDPEKRLIYETLWRVATPPEMGDDDHPAINPLAKGAPSLKGLGCGRVLVWVAEQDVLCERGRAYYEALRVSGWEGEAELLESKGEGHVFHLKKPTCEEALEKMRRFAAFLNGGN